MQKKLVSIIVPVYNTEKYLSECLDSIFAQTYKNIELIIINDCSPDNSEIIIKKYIEKYDNITYIKNEVNLGVSLSTNLAIKCAKGKYIAKMDSDDIAYPNRIEKQVDFLEYNDKYVLCGTDFAVIDEFGKHIEYVYKEKDFLKLKKDLLVRPPHAQPTIMIRKDILQIMGGYDVSLNTFEDRDLFIRLLQNNYKTINISIIGVKYRQHSNQLTNANNIKKLALDTFQYKIKAIKKYKIQTSFKDYILIYLSFIISYTLPKSIKGKIDNIYRYFIYKSG